LSLKLSKNFEANWSQKCVQTIFLAWSINVNGIFLCKIFSSFPYFISLEKLIRIFLISIYVTHILSSLFYKHEILCINYAKPNQASRFVRYNRVFAITVIVITEFDCIPFFSSPQHFLLEFNIRCNIRKDIVIENC